MHGARTHQLLHPDAHDKLLRGIHMLGLIVVRQTIDVCTNQQHQ